jgi:hypothetical protein
MFNSGMHYSSGMLNMIPRNLAKLLSTIDWLMGVITPLREGLCIHQVRTVAIRLTFQTPRFPGGLTGFCLVPGLTFMNLMSMISSQVPYSYMMRFSLEHHFKPSMRDLSRLREPLVIATPLWDPGEILFMNHAA